MKCSQCEGEVEPAIEEYIEEVNDDLLKLGKNPDVKPICEGCMMRIFTGEEKR